MAEWIQNKNLTTFLSGSVALVLLFQLKLAVRDKSLRAGKNRFPQPRNQSVRTNSNSVRQ
jgi:hypothetical protein